MRGIVIVVVAIVAIAAVISCAVLLSGGQPPGAQHHVGDEVTIAIPTAGCVDVKSGAVEFGYDSDVIGFINGEWKIDAFVSDVKDGEGVFALAAEADISATDDILKLRFRCAASGTATITAKLTFKGASGDVTEDVRPIEVRVS